MNKWINDVAVVCIFFARPDQFRQSFECVRKAKPRVLLLWQDGPREGRKDDMEKIMECREIAENIDWDCEVHRNYHDKNMGCDPSTHLSHKWAFSIVDKCIILEDDVIPAPSFFPFCVELLNRYENDTRVDRICGQTLYGGVPNKRYSYFFGRNGASTGWATWKRVADTWDSDYTFLDNAYYLDLAEHRFGHKRYKTSIETAIRHKEEGIPYWETIVGFRTTLNSGLVIYPSYNMIGNVGASENATHAPDNIRELPRYAQETFVASVNDIEFPLKHPPYVIEDYHYFETLMKMKHPNVFVRLYRKAERLYRIILVRVLKR